MIYCAILLVLTGLFILLLSVFAEAGKAEKFSGSASGYGHDLSGKAGRRADPESLEIPLPDAPVVDFSYGKEEDIFIDFSDDSSVPSKKDLLKKESDMAMSGGGESDYNTAASGLSGGDSDAAGMVAGVAPDSVSAVLFDDKSNMIDYDAGGAVLDPSLSAYKSIKRIGAGTLKAEKDGLSFYTGGSLHRFDFHKIFDVWSGSNFVALPLKGSSTVKLFIIENGAGFPDLVEVYFQEYTKG